LRKQLRAQVLQERSCVFVLENSAFKTQIFAPFALFAENAKRAFCLFCLSGEIKNGKFDENP